MHTCSQLYLIHNDNQLQLYLQTQTSYYAPTQWDSELGLEVYTYSYIVVVEVIIYNSGSDMTRSVAERHARQRNFLTHIARQLYTLYISVFILDIAISLIQLYKCSYRYTHIPGGRHIATQLAIQLRIATNSYVGY